MCRVVGVSRSGLYAWRRRPRTSARRAANIRLLTRIRAIHEASRGTYGSPRVHAQLRYDGDHVGLSRVERLMRQEGIQAQVRRRFRCTTDSKHDYPVATNSLDRQFNPERPDQVWVAGITYIWTLQGWMYLAVVIDLYSRRIIGWSMQDHMRTDLVVGAMAMAMALGHRKPEKDALHHSDRGSQYASFAFQKLLEQYGISCSMSRKANCLDNAVAESFFGTLKTELIHRRVWPTRGAARSAIHEYIEVFYNRRRLHSRLGYTSPVQFEANFHAANAA